MVRDHFGDLFGYLVSRGADMSKFSEEVLRAANLRGTEKLYPFGVGSYDRFPEVAERLGWVQSRLDNITTAEPIPTSWGGLLELADRMAEDKSAQDRLDKKGRKIISAGEVWGWPWTRVVLALKSSSSEINDEGAGAICCRQNMLRGTVGYEYRRGIRKTSR